MSKTQRFIIIALSCLIFLTLVSVAMQPIEYHLKTYTFVDDAYYYLGFANNLATYGQPTFDGLILTNGVQPLWAIMLSMVAVFTEGKLALMQASLFLSIVLVSLSYVFMFRLLQRFFETQVLYLTLLFYLSLIAAPSIFLTGMESSIILFTFTFALWAVLRIQSFNLIMNLTAGCILSLVFLARLDLLMMTPTFALLLIWSNGALKDRDWNKMVQSVVTLAIPCVIVLIIYIVFNLTVFDVPLPISGMVKSTLYGESLEAVGGRYSMQHLLQVLHLLPPLIGAATNFYFTTMLTPSPIITLVNRIIVLLGVLIIVFAIYRRRYVVIRSLKHASNKFKIENIVPYLIILNILFHESIQLFTTGFGNVSSLTWYHVHVYILLTFLLGFILSWLSKILSSRIINGIKIWALLSLVVGIGFWLSTFNAPPQIQRYDRAYTAVEWVNENVPEDAIIGSFNAGVLGYFTEQTVINLDGLMNNTEVLEILAHDDLFLDYARKHNITWFMDYQVNASDSLGTVFRRFPSDHLTIRYEVPFVNFSFNNSRFIVAEIDLSDTDNEGE